MLKRRKKEMEAGGFTHTAIGRLKAGWHRVKCWVVSRLSRYDQRLTLRQRKVHLFAFCLLMGGLSTWWLMEGFIQKRTGQPSYLQPQSITRPRDASLPDSLNVPYLEELERKRKASYITTDSTKQ